MNRAVILSFVLLLAIAGCGGSADVTPTPSNPPGTPPRTGPVAAATVVTVAAGSTVSGINIAVPAPAGGALNAEVLGVAPLSDSGGEATSTGASVRRGTGVRVLLFGPGLTGTLRVSISGPADITISNVRGIESTENTPGVAFDIAVAANAIPGARTVILRNERDDITTFTGGLEVLP